MEISYSYQVQQALRYACEAAEDCCNTSVGTEHLLIGILKIKDARLTACLQKRGVNDQSITQEVQILFGFDAGRESYGVYTSTLQAILKDAERKAQHNAECEVGIDDLSASLLERENNVALELLRRSGIVIEQLIEELNQNDVFRGCQELKNLNEAIRKRTGKTAGREKELEAMMHVLMRMEKSNCVLTGAAGVGKSAIVEELASRIVRKQVPDELKDCVIAELNVNQMVAGTKYRGEFEKKIQHLMEVLKSEKNIILFIDEMHLIVGAGKAEGSLDIASVLKPALSRSDIKVIGATTDEEYERWIMKDKALQRRFVRIEVQEPDEQMALVMLKEKGKDLSAYHDVKFQRGVLKHCLKISDLIFPHLKYPDKAIDLLDMSCVEARSRKEELVSLECVYDAARKMSDRPLHMKLDKFVHSICHETCLSMEEIQASLKYVLNHKSAVVWKFQGSAEYKSQVQHHLQEEMYAQIHRVHAGFFDVMSIHEILQFFQQKILGNKFHVFWIQEAQSLRKDVEQLLLRSELNALAQLNQMNVSFSGVLTVLEDSVSEGIGFFPEIDRQEENRIEWIEMDEIPALVVS